MAKRIFAITSCLILAIVSLFGQVNVKSIDGRGNEIVFGTGGVNYDLSLQVVPASLTVVTTKTVYVQAVHCANNTVGSVTLLMTDTAGNPFMPTIAIAANSVLTSNYNSRGIPLVGIKWQASAGTSIYCSLTGSQTN